jgi:AmmeMemoRadiSam system protein A
VSDLTDSDRRDLLKLARSAIEAELMAGKTPVRPEDPSPALKEKCGCFVTLHKRDALRGCIGSIEPKAALVAGVEENACHSAFRDPRFPAITEKELPDIEIEISVLSRPRPLEFTDAEDLKAQLIPEVHGVILEHGWQRATFLPQVWVQLPKKEDFLNHLCRKAGLDSLCWKDKETKVKVYEAEYFSEF